MKQSKNQQSGTNGKSQNMQAGKEQQRDRTSMNGENNNGNGQSSPLEKFFIEQLKDIYYAEQQLVKALPEMQKASSTEELEDAFKEHTAQTEKHVKRLEKIFQQLGKKPEGKKCEAMDGLLKEARSIISDTKEGSMTRDAALVIAAQKVEHYEIASYGGLVQLAITMKLDRIADLLDKTLSEEEETDQVLTDIAESHINMEAEDEGEYSWNKHEKEDQQEPEEAEAE